MIFRVSHRLLLSGNKFLCEFENVLRNNFRVEIIEYRVKIKQKRDRIRSLFCSNFQMSLYSLISYLYSLILFRTLHEQTNKIEYRLRRLLHILHRNPFLFAMEGMLASKDVRAR